jgi:glutamate/tyrosine decarboxylase-like PLP-dependent enzyme
MRQARREIWQTFADEVNDVHEQIREWRVTPPAAQEAPRARVERAFSFDRPRALQDVLRDASMLLRSSIVHVTHPRYFGLFNPSVLEASMVGDALAALYNPQLAARSHAPAAVEMERQVLHSLGALIGFPDPDGAFFTTGGAEANLSAVAVALADAFPEHATLGIAALARRPAIYLSAEAHDSFVKIARLTGLGGAAVRRVRVGNDLAMDPAALVQRIEEDRAAGWHPLVIVGTAGTTAAGVIDPLLALAEIADREGIWFHVDAAWGGSAALSGRLRPLLEGIERADSATWDAHKGMSVPMGAGMFFSRAPETLSRAFAVSATYMPAGGGQLDPFACTPQWSRRAIGLKVLFALAELGIEGYGELVESQARMGDCLREKLLAAGWTVVNRTALPVVCFTHPRLDGDDELLRRVCSAVQERGRVWISSVLLAGQVPALRACITSFRTEEADLDVLVAEIDLARELVESR